MWPLFGVFQCPAWDDPLPPGIREVKPSETTKSGKSRVRNVTRFYFRKRIGGKYYGCPKREGAEEANADRERIMATHDACRVAGRSGDAEAYIERNDAFHAAIHIASENRALRDQIQLLNKRLAPYRRFITFRPERKQAAEQEHEVLARALLKGDADAAARAMKEHVKMLAEDAFVLARSLRL